MALYLGNQRVSPNMITSVSGVTPSGTKNITDTSLTDVSLYQYAQVSDGNLVAENIKKDVSILGITGTLEATTPVSGTLQITSNGTFDVSDKQYAEVNVAARLSNPKTVTPSASSQTVLPDQGDDGLSQVTVSGDSNLVAGNIKKDVSIFGVTGTLESSSGGSSLPAGFWDKNSGSFDLTLPPEAVSLYDYLGYGMKIDTLTLNANTQFLGYNCFSNSKISTLDASACKNLIVGTAFENCTKLKTIKLPKNARFDGYNFKQAQPTTIIVPEGETNIRFKGFETEDENRTFGLFIPFDSNGLVCFGDTVIGYDHYSTDNQLTIDKKYLSFIPDRESGKNLCWRCHCTENFREFVSPSFRNSVLSAIFFEGWRLQGCVSQTFRNTSLGKNHREENDSSVIVKLEFGNSVANFFMFLENYFDISEFYSFPWDEGHRLEIIQEDGNGVTHFRTWQTGLEIPEGISSINIYGAFHGLYIPSLTLPSTITNISEHAFGFGPGFDQNEYGTEDYNQYMTAVPLTTITCKATTPPTTAENWLEGRQHITTIIVPAGTGDAYRAATGWSQFADKIVESTEF